jgi:polysaccharide export outer membrane protein
MRGRARLSVALLGLVMACAAPAPPSPEFEARPKEGAYVIGVADRIHVGVWQNQGLTLDGVPVRPDGKITMPLIDDVQAAGLTTDELKAVITEELREFVADPVVTVAVLAPNSQRAFVLGEVRSSGPITLSLETRILDAITSAGGFSTFYVDGRELEYRFDYDAYVDGDAPGTNVLLRPGDTVLVP